MTLLSDNDVDMASDLLTPTCRWIIIIILIAIICRDISIGIETPLDATFALHQEAKTLSRGPLFETSETLRNEARACFESSRRLLIGERNAWPNYPPTVIASRVDTDDCAPIAPWEVCKTER